MFDIQQLLAALAGGLVGFTLSLVGGGGSILAVPLLVYLVGITNPHVAIGTSAVSVALNAAMSLIGNLRRHLHDMVTGSGRSGSSPGEVGVGTKLLRQWHGTVYEGVVEADGVLINGRKYKSLTEAACDITGVRWSGPRFFGITKVKSQ